MGFTSHSYAGGSGNVSFPFELLSTCKAIASRDYIGSENPDDYTVHMGMGLFSSLDIHEQDVIAIIKEDIIYEREYQELKMLGKATYVVEVVKDTYLNCQSQRERGVCKALLTKSPSNAWDSSRGKRAEANCRLTRYTRNAVRELRLVCNVPLISARLAIL